MSDATNYEADVSRDEAADLLQELAREIQGQGQSEVNVGNKMLTLAPASTLTYDIEVEERSPMLGNDREKITVALKWKAEDGT